jgi:hypothetical protein
MALRFKLHFMSLNRVSCWCINYLRFDRNRCRSSKVHHHRPAQISTSRMLSHIFPHIILVNEGLIPPHSPVIQPLSTRHSALFPHGAETFFSEGSVPQRSSTYIRHIQSELNLHCLGHNINDSPVSNARLRASTQQSRRARSPTPLRRSFQPNEAMPSQPDLQARRTTSIGSISELLSAAQQPLRSPPLQRVRSTPTITLSHTFVHNNKRYSLLPQLLAHPDPVSSMDPLRAHQFSHWRSFSVPSSPARSAYDLHDIPELVSPSWPAERFYAQRHAGDPEVDAAGRSLRSGGRLNRLVRRVKGLFSRMR